MDQTIIIVGSGLAGFVMLLLLFGIYLRSGDTLKDLSDIREMLRATSDSELAICPKKRCLAVNFKKRTVCRKCGTELAQETDKTA